MHRLIWGFAGCTYHIVGNTMSRLNYEWEKYFQIGSEVQDILSGETSIHVTFDLPLWPWPSIMVTETLTLHVTLFRWTCVNYFQNQTRVWEDMEQTLSLYMVPLIWHAIILTSEWGWLRPLLACCPLAQGFKSENLVCSCDLWPKALTWHWPLKQLKPLLCTLSCWGGQICKSFQNWISILTLKFVGI